MGVGMVIPNLWLATLTILATLSHPLGMMLPLLHGILAVRYQRGQLRWTMVHGMLWAGCYWGIRQWQGVATRQTYTLQTIFTDNTQQWGIVIAVNLAIYGLAIAVLRRLPHTPIYLRWTASIIIPYGVLVLMFGRWDETRLLLPILPIAIALLLSDSHPSP